MTEAEAKAIEHDEAEQIALAYIDEAFGNAEKPGRRLRHSIPANPREDTDLRLMAYIKQQRASASRLLAIEAEMSELKSSLEFLNARNFDGHGWHPERIVELARRQGHTAPPSPPLAPEPSWGPPASPPSAYRSEQHPGLERLRGDIDPVCDPVAPEPAQENQGPSGQKENDNGNRNDGSATTEQREAGDAGLVRSEADSARDDRCPEGGAEVEGEGVGHHQARRSAVVGRRSDDGRVAELEAKVAELEQERADLHGALGDMEHAERERLAAEPAQEAGGVERVNHEVARSLAASLEGGSWWIGWDKDMPRGPTLLRYIDQQEQSEREAAEAVELMAKEHAAAIRIAADRDAERTQKEALQAELDALTADTDASVAKDTAAYNTVCAENELLKAKLELFKLGAQPAEAAPVAKAEAPSERFADYPDERRSVNGAERCPTCNGPKEHRRMLLGAHNNKDALYCTDEWHGQDAEAPSEPAGWVPHAFQVVRVKGLNLRHGEEGTVVGHDSADGKFALHMHKDGQTAHYQLSDLEPAPQPPATTGDRAVMMGELIDALRKVGGYKEPDVFTGAEAVAIVAEELVRIRGVRPRGEP